MHNACDVMQNVYTRRQFILLILLKMDENGFWHVA